MASVLSVEPFSTTMVSNDALRARAPSTTYCTDSARISDSLYAGITTESTTDAGPLAPGVGPDIVRRVPKHGSCNGRARAARGGNSRRGRGDRRRQRWCNAVHDVVRRTE